MQPDMEVPHTCVWPSPPPRPLRGYGGGRSWVQGPPCLHGDSLTTVPRPEHLHHFRGAGPGLDLPSPARQETPASLPRGEGPKASLLDGPGKLPPCSSSHMPTFSDLTIFFKIKCKSWRSKNPNSTAWRSARERHVGRVKCVAPHSGLREGAVPTFHIATIPASAQNPSGP